MTEIDNALSNEEGELYIPYGTGSRGSAYKNKYKKKLYRRAQGKCALCGHGTALSKATIDHIIPISRGGSWDRHNIQLCCRKCNQAKADKTNNEYTGEL